MHRGLRAVTIAIAVIASMVLCVSVFAESQTRTDWTVLSNTGNWFDPGAINHDGGAYAAGTDNAYLTLGSQSGFDIPSSAVITGIEYRVDAWSPNGSTMTTYFRVGSVDWSFAMGGIEWLVTAEHTYTYGGPNQLWGESWTPARINQYDILVLRADFLGLGLMTHIDYAEVTIYYTTADTTPPVLTVPEDITIECDESCDPSNTGQATATDDLDPSPVVTYSDHQFGMSSFSFIERTWTATDATGNSSSQMQEIRIRVPEVTITDVIPSWVTSLPASIDVSFTVEKCASSARLFARCNENWSVHHYSTEGSVISDGTTVNTQGIDVPAGAPEGTYQLFWTMLDGSSPCWFGLNAPGPSFLYGIDLTSPVIEGCPHDITVVSALGEDTVAVSWTEPTASDAVSGVASLVSTHAPRDVFPAGTTEVVYTATDVAGNVSTCSFDVTVAVINLPSGATGGDGRTPSLLDAPILLDPAEAPLVGDHHLCGVCEIGDPLGGSFMLLGPNGLPMRGMYVILYVYSVELIDETPHLTLVDHWSVGYDTETSDWNFDIPTEDLAPGYYYIYLSFPGGATLTLPVEITAL